MTPTSLKARQHPPGRGGKVLLALLLVLAASTSGAEEPPAAALESVFADWQAWSRGAERLEAAIDHFAALRSNEWRRPADLLAALRARDEVRREAARVDGFLSFRLDLNGRDEEALARRPRMDALSARWDAASSWFQPRLRAMGLERLKAWTAAAAAEPALAPYRWQLESSLRATPKALSAGELEILGLADLERATARRVHAALLVTEGPRITIRLRRGETFEIDAARARRLAAELADPLDRAAARRAWLEALAGHAETGAALLEGVVRREAFAARAQGFGNALEAALAADGIPEEVVRRMLAAARGAAPATARWHAARRRHLGLERYGTADIEVPLGEAPRWSWEEARARILAAVEPLGPEIAGLFARAFREGWIDAVDRPAKRPLGFSTFVYGDRPFVSVVYRGTTPDLFSLIHELAHAVHHALAFGAQPYEVSRPSTLVGETAAAVAESLLARHLSARAGSAGLRTTVADLEARSIQRFFLDTALDADFELAVHEIPGSFSAARLGDLYRDRLTAFHGGALDLEPWDRHGWLETPHFWSAPLSMARYGLSYAAASALVEDLVAAPEETRDAARQRYLALLSAGASDAPLALLAAAGADLRDPATLEAVPRRLAELAAALEK